MGSSAHTVSQAHFSPSREPLLHLGVTMEKERSHAPASSTGQLPASAQQTCAQLEWPPSRIYCDHPCVDGANGRSSTGTSVSGEPAVTTGPRSAATTPQGKDQVPPATPETTTAQEVDPGLGSTFDCILGIGASPEAVRVRRDMLEMAGLCSRPAAGRISDRTRPWRRLTGMGR